MLSIKELDFILEQHPFYGITIKVQHNNKTMGTYSPQLPQDVRAMLRKVLSHKDISENLEDFLLNANELPTITIKVKYNKFQCEWNKDLFYEKKLCFNIDNSKVLINQDDTTDDILFLSNIFCYFKPTQQLGRITSSQGFQSIDQLSIQNFQDNAVQKLFKKKKYEISHFNQLPFKLINSQEFKKCRFICDRKEVYPKEIEGDLVVNIDYSLEKSIVKFSMFLKSNTDIHPIFNSMYKQFKNQAILFDKYSTKRKRLLLKWLVLFVNASPKKQEHLIKKYLPKITLLNETQLLVHLINSISTEYIYQLKVMQEQWFIYKTNFYKELVITFMLSILFPESSENSDDFLELIIYKTDFNKYLKLIKTLCHQLNLQVSFSNIEVNVVEKKLTIDLSDEDNLASPKVYLNNMLIEDENLIDLKTNLWSSLNNESIEVFDESLISQCEQLILIKEFHKKKSKVSDTNTLKNNLHLLDWIQLRSLGVDVKLSKKQEALMNSFMSFKNLEKVTTPKGLSATPRTYQKDGLNWMMFLYQFKLGGVLADDMGLGKTFQSLMLLSSIKEKKLNDGKRPHLIVVPPSLVFNWHNEFKRFCPHISVTSYVGQDRSLENNAEVVITSYELIRRENERFSEIDFDIVIFDEAQFIKNSTSARSKAANNIKRNCCLCLTGTPIENHVGEYINILNTALFSEIYRWTDMIYLAVKQSEIQGHVEKGDCVVVTAGIPIGRSNGINSIRIINV